MTQAKIVAKIRKLGYKVTVLNASARNRRGIPDILVSLDGAPYFFEIKIDNDKLSKLQKDFINEFYSHAFGLHYDSKRKHYTLIMSTDSLLITNHKLDRFISSLNDGFYLNSKIVLL